MISPHIALLREYVGHDLLLLPAASVLPVDDAGRVLLVWPVGAREWHTLGGFVEPGESPADTAVREAREETGAEVKLTRLVDVFGGPECEHTYPNGDRVAYVCAFYEGRIISGDPAPADGELSKCAWFTPRELAAMKLGSMDRLMLHAAGWLG